MKTAYEAGKEYNERGWDNVIVPRIERMLEEMAEHVHEWRVLKPELTEPDWYIWCPECGGRMDTIEEIESRLNATERLSAGSAELLFEMWEIWIAPKHAIYDDFANMLKAYADILERK